MRAEHTHAESALLIVWPYREEVPQAYSKETRGKSLARPCSGHYALTADCRFPWPPIRQQRASLSISSFIPPRLGVAHASRHNNTRLQTFYASIENASLVLPVEHRQFEPRPEGSLERCIFANGISLLALPEAVNRAVDLRTGGAGVLHCRLRALRSDRLLRHALSDFEWPSPPCPRPRLRHSAHA